MIDIRSISAGLQLQDDGIWYGKDDENISYPSDGNDACFAVEDNSFWFRHRNESITTAVKSCPPEDNGTIFDIGGGNGFVSLGLMNAGFNVVLVEPGPRGAANAKRRGVSNVICASTQTAGFKPRSFPAVGLFDVIEHIEDDREFLESIRDLMEINARLYLTVPSYLFLWSREDVSAGHFRRYAMRGVLDLLRSAGFQVEFASHIFRFLPFPIFFMRSLPYRMGFSKMRSSTKRTSNDHELGDGFLARIVSSFLQSEIRNLRNRKAMSFGGSCLVVARNP